MKRKSVGIKISEKQRKKLNNLSKDERQTLLKRGFEIINTGSLEKYEYLIETENIEGLCVYNNTFILKGVKISERQALDISNVLFPNSEEIKLKRYERLFQI